MHCVDICTSVMECIKEITKDYGTVEEGFLFIHIYIIYYILFIYICQITQTDTIKHIIVLIIYVGLSYYTALVLPRCVLYYLIGKQVYIISLDYYFFCLRWNLFE